MGGDIAEDGQVESSSRELDLREREVIAKEREVAVKEQELKRSRWLNPTTIALFVAAFGLVGNLVVAGLNNTNSQTVERIKSQSNAVLQAIRTDSPNLSCTNLDLFLRLKLIADPDSAIHRVCAPYVSPGAPSLPTSMAPEASLPQTPQNSLRVSDKPSNWSLYPPNTASCYQERSENGSYSVHCHWSQDRCDEAKKASRTATACLSVEGLAQSGWRPANRGFMDSWYQLGMSQPLRPPFPQFK